VRDADILRFDSMFCSSARAEDLVMSVCRSMWSNASVSVRRASAFLIPMTYHRTTGAIQNVVSKVASAQDVQPETESKPILPQRTANILVPNISTEIIMEPTTCGTHHTHAITHMS
jgi:hypothetical protein